MSTKQTNVNKAEHAYRCHFFQILLFKLDLCFELFIAFLEFLFLVLETSDKVNKNNERTKNPARTHQQNESILCRLYLFLCGNLQFGTQRFDRRPQTRQIITVHDHKQRIFAATHDGQPFILTRIGWNILSSTKADQNNPNVVYGIEAGYSG